ncbi:hypothetical protein AURDEDRAFT_131599 [Auricularia subglabra TFB-10046 SS5]|uniref:Uncharacterized protein n=1 Tax=Auricularia subglabra (strain TFB-10046 / SS5) TaxID=717982 RepID=J0D4E6_AURST|nr:hypothetical protein AURDEDRAFT_131599 [Auricularia subglabra TFB-10046 SS5]
MLEDAATGEVIGEEQAVKVDVVQAKGLKHGVKIVRTEAAAGGDPDDEVVDAEDARLRQGTTAALERAIEVLLDTAATSENPTASLAEEIEASFIIFASEADEAAIRTLAHEPHLAKNTVPSAGIETAENRADDDNEGLQAAACPFSDCALDPMHETTIANRNEEGKFVGNAVVKCQRTSTIIAAWDTVTLERIAVDAIQGQRGRPLVDSAVSTEVAHVAVPLLVAPAENSGLDSVQAGATARAGTTVVTLTAAPPPPHRLAYAPRARPARVLCRGPRCPLGSHAALECTYVLCKKCCNRGDCALSRHRSARMEQLVVLPSRDRGALSTRDGDRLVRHGEGNRRVPAPIIGDRLVVRNRPAPAPIIGDRLVVRNRPAPAPLNQDQLGGGAEGDVVRAVQVIFVVHGSGGTEETRRGQLLVSERVVKLRELISSQRAVVLSDIVQSSLELACPEGWKPLDDNKTVYMEGAQIVQLRGSLMLGFPLAYVEDMAEGLQCYAEWVDSLSSAEAFKKAFPRCAFSPELLSLAVSTWNATPAWVKKAFTDAGRTGDGLWSEMAEQVMVGGGNVIAID